MVIQRWQTVLLLIASVLMGVFSFVSLGQIQLTDYSLNFTTLGFYIEGESTGGAESGFMAYTWPFFILSIMSSVIPLINIFLFRNLPLQKRVCLVEVLFLVATACLGAVYGYTTFDGASVSWSSAIVAPLIALIADIMAYNRIRCDHKLLCDSERLR